MRVGMQAAQIWRREEEMPNRLFPTNSNAGTINPISGPDMYQGHGELWKAESTSGQIEKGVKIKVVSIENLKLFVDRA